MNKKTLIMILIVPFIIALLGFSNVILIKNFVEVDISGISWKYNEKEGFKVSDNGYLLEATGVVGDGLKLSEGNNLIWYLDEESEYAKINKEDDKYYLFALKEGEVEVTCSNEKKTLSRKFTAVIYENGAIIINPASQGSGYSVTNTRYFGEYDINYDENTLLESSLTKTRSKIDFNLTEYGEYDPTSYQVENSSSNINVSVNGNKVEVHTNGSGEAYFTIRSNANTYLTSTYSFKIVPDGVNVYDYLDLLMCTNKSSNGEIVCLQTSLESKSNTFNSDGTYKENNVRLFGNENGLNFKNEVYTFNSTYNTNYIKQLYGEDSTYDDLITGIRVQKDFYGNGYIINGKELTYPNNGKINSYTGKLEPGENDLFKGPLTFFSIGEFKAPIIKAFGQDNSLMYIDGDNVTINDLIIENTDTFNNTTGEDTSSNNMYNLEYTGTTIDVHASNVTIKNSELKNGRTALRVYSSPNFTLDNSLLSTAREFLMKIGNDEYNKINLEKNVNFAGLNKVFNGKLGTFLTNHLDSSRPYYELTADELVSAIFNSESGISSNDYEQLLKLQEGLDENYLNNLNNIIYGQEITVKDSYFYRSGIYSIAFDTYFNGCFLYNGIPSFIINTFNQIMPGVITQPNNISGTMKPSLLNLEGDVRFYDWKNIETIDASCLIEERLGEFLGSIPDIGDLVGDLDKIDIDSYFPMKSLLASLASNKNYVYQVDEDSYLNTPIAYYGGGSNLSSVNYQNVTNLDLGEVLDVDILSNALYNTNFDNIFAAVLAKCVPLAAGFNNFKFYTNGTYTGTPYLFNEVPNKNDFKLRA